MTPIQIILLSGLAGAACVTGARWRRNEIRPIAAATWILIWTFGAVFTVNPSWSTSVAHALGVGRGADLVTYISIVFLFFAVFRLLIRTERQRKEMTELVRRLAIDEQLKKDAEQNPPSANPHA